MKTDTYINPVYPGSFPDPFVLKYGGEYFGYCTGIQPDGRCFGILRSPDLVKWETLPGAMKPLPGGHTMYWAPEVLYDNGLFYMYYSVGNETFMEIRVAVAAQPAGPFEDSGRTLTTQQFAIDAHVFKDDDGALYLFYATDFLEHPRVGTGTVIDRLLDPLTPEGKPRPVTRASYDWQIYDPNRAEKGGVRWHTIEGSFVLKHHGKYYQMFSGGNWQNLSYGVSYATSNSLDRPDEWDQAADGEKILPVLRTIPGKVVGPGHNSVVRGPDNRQLYCVYHRWSEDGNVRQMAIDPLDWAGDRLIVLGPSYEPQPYPTLPTVIGSGNFTGDKPGLNWTASGGDWQVQDNTLLQNSVEEVSVSLRLDYHYFLLEIEIKALKQSPGSYGFDLDRGGTGLLTFQIKPERGEARLTWPDEINSTREQIFTLPVDFDPTAYHLLRLEVQSRQVTLWLDGVRVHSDPVNLSQEADNLRLTTHAAPAAFTGFALTPGFEDPFLPGNDADTTFTGWQPETAQATSSSEVAEPLAIPPVFTKGDPLENYELVINLLLEGVPGGETAFFPAWSKKANGPKISFQQGTDAGGWTLQTDQGETFLLPEDFDPKIYQQFRFRKQDRHLAGFWGNHFLGELEVAPGSTRVGLVEPTRETIEMVRVTAL